MKRTRDDAIDIVRGIAITSMVYGHGATEWIAPPGERLSPMLGGHAPAMFLVLAGMMVWRGIRLSGYSLGHFVKRAALVMGVGVFIDVAIWRIWPFTSVDVLYLIATALLLTAIATPRIPPRWLALLGVLIIAVAPPLQDAFGYTELPLEYPLSGEVRPREVQIEGGFVFTIETETSVLQHWFIDGWFPIFPWLGFAFLGSALGAYRWPDRDTIRRFGLGTALLPALVLLYLGGIYFGFASWEYEVSLRLRAGGAFMPPGYDYLLTTSGLLVFLLWLADRRPDARIWAPFRILGRQAILSYVVHWPAIAVSAFLIGHRVPHTQVMLLALAVLTGLVILSYFVEEWQQRRRAARRGSSAA